MKEDIKKILGFIQEVENLKSVLRSGKTSTGRQESTAEHTWRLSLMIMLLEDYLPECDPHKMLQLSIVHDLGELYEGDIPAVEKVDDNHKYKIEEKALKKISSILPIQMGNRVYDLWKEYEDNLTIESKVVKALDKIETIIQHNQGKNNEGFDYAFNIDYGKKHVLGHDLLELIREIVDEETKNMAEKM